MYGIEATKWDGAREYKQRAPNIAGQYDTVLDVM